MKQLPPNSKSFLTVPRRKNMKRFLEAHNSTRAVDTPAADNQTRTSFVLLTTSILYLASSSSIYSFYFFSFTLSLYSSLYFFPLKSARLNSSIYTNVACRSSLLAPSRLHGTFQPFSKRCFSPLLYPSISITIFYVARVT